MGREGGGSVGSSEKCERVGGMREASVHIVGRRAKGKLVLTGPGEFVCTRFV